MKLKQIDQLLNDLDHKYDNLREDSKLIACNNVNISFGSKQILKAADVNILSKHRYGLISPNGQGKSTILKSLANREAAFSTIPTSLDIFYVNQEVDVNDKTVLENALLADSERNRLLEAESFLLERDELERLNRVYDYLKRIDSETFESRCHTILSGLQFTKEIRQMPISALSGGWRMRLSIATGLIARPSLLLLDEPDNHLDLIAVIWLENYLATQWKNTAIIVSHNQGFLDNVCTDILHLSQLKLHSYRGDYTDFKRLYAHQIELVKREHEKITKQIKELKKHASNNKNKIDSLTTKLNSIVIPPEYKVKFKIPEPSQLSHPIFQVHNVSFGYPNREELFYNLDFGLDQTNHIGILGLNGVGKTSLLKLLAGELRPTSGQIDQHKKLIIGYFAQHFAERLNYDETPVNYLMNKFSDYTVGDVRQLLGQFGLSGSTHLQTLNSLSGGQKSRILLCELFLRKPQLLFLDEPSAHLDLESINALIEALKTYSGGFILISHDAHLIREVCSELWVVKDKNVSRYEGDYDDYREEVLESFEN